MDRKLEVAPAAEVQRNFSLWQDKALRHPVAISRNGRARIVMMAIEEYERLKRRDRRVMTLDDFTEEDIEAIRAAKVPDEYAYLAGALAGLTRSRAART